MTTLEARIDRWMLFVSQCQALALLQKPVRISFEMVIRGSFFWFPTRTLFLSSIQSGSQSCRVRLQALRLSSLEEVLGLAARLCGLCPGVGSWSLLLRSLGLSLLCGSGLLLFLLGGIGNAV